MHRWLASIATVIAMALPAIAIAQPTQPDPAADTEKPAAPADSTKAAPEPDVVKTSAPAAESTPAAESAPDSAVVPPEGGVPAVPKRRSSYASNFMDSRLNFTLTNENVFAAPGETIPSVPGWRFGVPNSLGTLFFDNYDTRFSGYETLSHAVLYKRNTKENWEAEGALVLRINDVAENTIDLSDAGSYLRVAYWKDPSHKDPTRISLVAFPTSSDRMRLGYSYRLSWGGSPEYGRSKQAVPGMKVQYDTGDMYVYGGAKSAVVLDRQSAEEEAVLAFLFGAGIDVTPMLRIEANGGYFNRGSNELQDVLDQDVQLFGGSVQVALHKGMPVGTSIDYRLYRNDPLRQELLFRRAEYPGGLSWLVTSEATVIGQTLKNPEVTGATRAQWGAAGDVNVRIKNNHTRLRLDVQYRDLAYILHSTPSLPTFSDFPMAYEKTANLFAAAGVDQNFRDQLTLGFVIGIDMPATLTTPTGVIPGDVVGGSGRSTAVIRSEGDLTILPEGESAVPQFAAKFTARLDFNDFFATILDVYYSRDANRTRLVRDDVDDLLRREFGEFNQLGFNLTLQSRF